MKTTVDIPDVLYSQARELATARGQQIAALITEGLQNLVVAHRPHLRAGASKNGKARQPALPPKAGRWLAEWRSLSQQQPASKTQGSSAAEIVSRMRR